MEADKNFFFFNCRKKALEKDLGRWVKNAQNEKQRQSQENHFMKKVYDEKHDILYTHM